MILENIEASQFPASFCVGFNCVNDFPQVRRERGYSVGKFLTRHVFSQYGCMFISNLSDGITSQVKPFWITPVLIYSLRFFFSDTMKS